MDTTFTKVSFKDRSIAFTWDFLMMLGCYFGVFILAGFIGQAKSDLNFSVAVVLVLIYTYFRDGREGESKGKRNAQIVVINKSSKERISYLYSFIRQAPSFISILAITFILTMYGVKVPPYFLLPSAVLIADILLILFSPSGQRIGDLIANTQVVYWEDFQKFESGSVTSTTFENTILNRHE